MKRLSRNQIDKSLEEEMATIYPGPSTRESRLANTWPDRKLPAPLTPDQLAEVREKAQQQPQHHTHSAANAERAEKLAAQTEQRRLAAVAAQKSK
jgi:hypothetical protein